MLQFCASLYSLYVYMYMYMYINFFSPFYNCLFVHIHFGYNFMSQVVCTCTCIQSACTVLHFYMYNYMHVHPVFPYNVHYVLNPLPQMQVVRYPVVRRNWAGRRRPDWRPRKDLETSERNWRGKVTKKKGRDLLVTLNLHDNLPLMMSESLLS